MPHTRSVRMRRMLDEIRAVPGTTLPVEAEAVVLRHMTETFFLGQQSMRQAVVDLNRKIEDLSEQVRGLQSQIELLTKVHHG